MSGGNIDRLLRVAAARNKRHEYTILKVRTLRTTLGELRRRCQEDGITLPALVEALVRGYNNKDPSALAMVDHWIRDEGLEREPPRGPSLNKRDLEEVYAAIATIESPKE